MVVAFPGGTGTVDEFPVHGGGPGTVIGAVALPPFDQPGTPIGEGAFAHLQAGDPPGPAGGGEHAPPGGDAAFLLSGVEEHERGM